LRIAVIESERMRADFLSRSTQLADQRAAAVDFLAFIGKARSIAAGLISQT
jgi:hypothetical protein